MKASFEIYDILGNPLKIGEKVKVIDLNRIEVHSEGLQEGITFHEKYNRGYAREQEFIEYLSDESYRIGIEGAHIELFTLNKKPRFKLDDFRNGYKEDEHSIQFFFVAGGKTQKKLLKYSK